MKFVERKAVPPISRLQIVTDLVFIITLILAIALALLGSLLGVMYWTKVDLNVDLFDSHIFDLILCYPEVNFA